MSRPPGYLASLFRHRDARTLFGEGLTEIHRIQSDFLGEREQLRLGESSLRLVCAARLELERARDHALYGSAVY